jgi:hypothetical protein
MSSQPTLQQTAEEQLQAQQQSAQRQQPPASLPGYEFAEAGFLGRGAYGEVWLAVDRKTGRRVAVKFYTQRGGLDLPLLLREVEKLSLLFSDRYVVQLIDVNWEGSPPYYVMEHVERGSLQKRVDQQPLAIDEAVALFREIAQGLVHLHGKGVLHCDLKPANVLLDQDDRPRLADFGTARLTHEQMPALGTLCYMAPEQADLKAAPDARWDVYALGALLYCMLTGKPPFHGQADATAEPTGGLEEKLGGYRRLIDSSPSPREHRRVPGMDRDLADIVDRCLERQPGKRYGNVQAVLTALDARAARRARRPLLVLGAFGPALLLAIASLFAWRGIVGAEANSERAIRRRALESNLFAAQLAAEKVSRELADNFRAAESVAADRRLPAVLRDMEADAGLRQLSAEIDAIDLECVPRIEAATGAARQALEAECDARVLPLQEQFRANPLHERLHSVLAEHRARLNAGYRAGEERVQSLVFDDWRGTALARDPLGDTTGRNFSFRSYFKGGTADQRRDWRCRPGEHVRRTHLSAVFQSSASGKWIVAVSTPVWDGATPPQALGVLIMTVEVRHLIESFEGRPQQFASLVDGRAPHQGLMLQHRLFDLKQPPFEYEQYRDPKYLVPLDALPEPEDLEAPGSELTVPTYEDPMRHDTEGAPFEGPWLAVKQAVLLPRPTGTGTLAALVGQVTPETEETGLYVIVQEDLAAALQPVRQLGGQLVRQGLFALGLLLFVITALWGLVVLVLNESSHSPLLRALRRRAGLPTARTSLSVAPSGTPSTGPPSSPPAARRPGSSRPSP